MSIVYLKPMNIVCLKLEVLHELRKRLGVKGEWTSHGEWAPDDTFLYREISKIPDAELNALAEDPGKLDVYAVQLKLTR